MQGSAHRNLVCVCAAVFALVAATGHAQSLTTQRVASGLSRPLFVIAPPGDTERLFIVQQGTSQANGMIRIMDLATGNILPSPFLSVAIGSGSERGLLGLAFHPDYDENGYFYVNYSRPGDGDTVIARYKVSDGNPNVADPNSAMQLMTIDQPFSNHNGGWIGFGPNDGYLYIATGDGGSGNDPGDRAQNLDVLLGKMLRIDVDGDDFPGDPNNNYAIPQTNPFVGIAGSDEIWAYGLRNPWRSSFDRANGDLYIGDVGQVNREEINYQPGDSEGGENYGWKCEEGFACGAQSSQYCDCGDENLLPPILDLTRGLGSCITGGYVYRGSAIPSLSGTYFYADYGSNRIWSLRYDGQNLSEHVERTTELKPEGFTINSIASFGEDGNGELYICDIGGEIFKIISAAPPCEDIKKVKTNCNKKGKVKATVKLTNANSDGLSVVIAINGDNFDVPVNGKKAKLKECCYEGAATVELLDPADCKPAVEVDCP